MLEQLQEPLGVRHESLDVADPKKQLPWPVHPLDPRHPLRPSVLDARLARSQVQIPRLRSG
jgi:hypothetical protein